MKPFNLKLLLLKYIYKLFSLSLSVLGKKNKQLILSWIKENIDVIIIHSINEEKIKIKEKKPKEEG